MASSTHDFVDQYLRQTAEIALSTSREDLARVIDVLFGAYRQDRTIYTCGNGGSAANASHLACDIAKFTWVDGKRRFKCASLCDNAALISALTNDVGFGRVFLEQLDGRLVAGDVLVCLSVHGGSGADKAGPWSQNLVAAADFAKKHGANVVALVGYDGGALRQMADASVVVPPAGGGHTSTPHVEGFHEVYHHLICERLLQLVADGGVTRGAILDRDGTLVDVVRDADLGVVTTAFHPDQLRLLPGVLEGLRALSSAGFVLAIATNQPGAAKGQIPLSAIERTNAALIELLAAQGIEIAALEACLHHPEGGPGGDASLVGPCACRKPAAGMLARIAARLGLDAASSWMIGDSEADVLAARAGGLRAGLLFDRRRCEICPLRQGSGVSPDATAARLDALAAEILSIG